MVMGQKHHKILWFPLVISAMGEPSNGFGNHNFGLHFISAVVAMLHKKLYSCVRRQMINAHSTIENTNYANPDRNACYTD